MKVDEIKAVFTGRSGRLRPVRSYAVLVPLIEMEDSLHLLYQVRSHAVRQPGEVSFPGGQIEVGESPFQAALRETEEEIGIRQEAIEVIGELDALLNHEQNLVYPFLGLINIPSLGEISVNACEVESLFTVPIDFFLRNKPVEYPMAYRPDDDGIFPYHRIKNGDLYLRRSIAHPVYFYEYDGHTIWGLTAKITREFIRELIKSRPGLKGGIQDEKSCHPRG